ncbi:MAG TPA: DUF2442 domain-containing protein [Mariniphaga anaerophila]|uniref:DUF2442 domain-containing protein n=1 Tax=Mariniphaga anaerophila TaxID=1484053 RepID=A0A831LLW1_9BACT|nr:DUF2442 domain-containing protein [Mariniphaga anaerophila]
MNPRVKIVKPLKDYKIYLEFNNGEVKIFDVKPFLSKGIFKELQNPEMFNSVRVVDGSVQWNNEADFCPDTLYVESAEFSLIR